jgi:phospholipid/cholesterol/gamma-HCH transport system substrate-binding protein
MMNDLKIVVDGINNGEGTAGLILNDTALGQSLSNSVNNIELGTGRFNLNRH